MYDDIAEVYHLVYEDWEGAVRRFGKALHDKLTGELGEASLRVLDVSCGIGTQALGLAAHGHRVTASDLSPGAVGRARREAAARGLAIDFSVADMRGCHAAHGTGFDAVISCDNSLPHLDRAGVEVALSSMAACLSPGGLLLVSLRDYRPDESRGKGEVWTYGTRTAGDDRFVVFQTRDWEGDCYDVAMYFVREARDGVRPRVIAGRSRYFAIEVDDVGGLIEAAGLTDVARIDELLHQPVLTARRPA